MVRIIPNRLKSGLSSTTTVISVSNSRSSSPMRNKRDSASPEGRLESGLMLQVLILRARNLAAKDRGGTSDPYLVLTLGDAKHITHAVSKSLNPDWNEQCELPANDYSALLLDVCCWDKDRFGKDYLGEFDLALEEIFLNEKAEQPPTWFPLKSKRPGKKTGVVSGEVLLQFTLLDASLDASKDRSDAQILEKLYNIAKSAPTEPPSRNITPTRTPIVTPTVSAQRSYSPAEQLSRGNTDNDEYEEYDVYDDSTPDEEDPSKPETAEKRKRRLRISGLKRKKRENPYEFFNGGSDVVGIIFLEICNITDLPPESNLTKTSFDMDPFVVASLGKKTYRTKTIRHNLNPVFNEKMIFQVQSHEQSYQFSFTIMDHDKYSGNDFVASVNLPVKEILDKSPKADSETGLYNLREPPEYTVLASRSKLKILGMSRSSSVQSLKQTGRPTPAKNPSVTSTVCQTPATSAPGSTGIQLPAIDTSDGSTFSLPSPKPLTPNDISLAPSAATLGETGSTESDESAFYTFTLPLKMKNKDKWESKNSPQLYIRAKYMPYPALRQQFWRAMLKQYDADESGRISKVELTTMLDTLGSTLRESTIDSFFNRFSNGADFDDLTLDQAVICLEDQLVAKAKPSMTERFKNILPDVEKVKSLLPVPGHGTVLENEFPAETLATIDSPSDSQTNTSIITVPGLGTLGEEGEILERDDLNNGGGEEHVVEIRECPICHQPRLDKRKEADIITHIATCASQDWRQVNNLVMAGFVTSSQAQRKWYSKVITKISYGGYKLGANSANILVQDRITGQISEEKMSVYVRLGIRLLYKGLKSNSMEKKRIRKLLKSLSIKQGKKYDDPASRAEIQKFIEFHHLDMSEVLLPLSEFQNFNEFFYRALKPNARPCSAPDNPRIVVSPADCRSVVFNRVDIATKIWVKGREFSVKRLLGDAYPDDAYKYESGGALGIFRLAPQDYHRFHIPVDGTMREPKTIQGEYYTVNPMAIRSALDVYGENVRVIVPIDSPAFGRVMVVCIGAMMVGSTVITRTANQEVKRAEELGYFKFGGSTIVLLFELGKMVFDDDLVDNSNGALETLIRVGMSVGHAPNEPKWTPDMPKPESEITEEEKQEAKRRIQGTVESPDDSGGDDFSQSSNPAVTGGF